MTSIDWNIGCQNAYNTWLIRSSLWPHQHCLMSFNWIGTAILLVIKTFDTLFESYLFCDSGKALRRWQKKSSLQFLWPFLRRNRSTLFHEVSGIIRPEHWRRRNHKNCWTTAQCQNQCRWSNSRMTQQACLDDIEVQSVIVNSDSSIRLGTSKAQSQVVVMGLVE